MSFREWQSEQKPIVVWRENLPSLELWNTVGDQFRMGFNGPVALDLIPVFHELDRRGLENSVYDQLLGDMKAMGSAAISAMNPG